MTTEQPNLDDFEVVRELGAGASGIVYEVHSRVIGASYAMKRFQIPSFDARMAMLRELQTWIDLPDHPGLLPLAFARTQDSELMLFTEVAEHGSLADLLHQHSSMNIEALLELAIQVAEGLAAAHAAEYVHHDIKPQNILVDGARFAKVGDFGLARAKAALGTNPHRLARGTPAYRSPEQARGALTDLRTDIFSFGATLLAAVLGDAQWADGQAVPHVVKQLLTSGALPAAAPRALFGVIEQCTRSRPGERPESMREVIDALRQIHANLSGARPVPVPTAAPRHVWRTTVDRKDVPENAREAAFARWAAVREQALGRPIMLPRSGSARARAVAEIALYVELRLHLAAHGSLSECAEIQRDLADALDTLGDTPGALQAHRDSIWFRVRLVDQQPERESWFALASALSELGRRELELNLTEVAQRTLGAAFEVCETPIRIHRWTEFELIAIDVLQGLLACAHNRGDYAAVLRHANNIIALCEGYLSSNANNDEESEPARAYFRALAATMHANAASMLDVQGDMRAARERYEVALVIQEQLCEAGLLSPLKLANTLANSAETLYRSCQEELARARLLRAAQLCSGAPRSPEEYRFRLYLEHLIRKLKVSPEHQGLDTIVSQIEHQVVKEGQAELALDLAQGISEHAGQLAQAGDRDQASVLYARATAILEKLDISRRPVKALLASTLGNHAKLDLSADTPSSTSIERYARAIGLYEELVAAGDVDKLLELARAQGNHATLVYKREGPRPALPLRRIAVQSLERAVAIMPDGSLAHLGLGEALAELGNTLMELRRPGPACERFEAAIDVLTRSPNPGLHHRRFTLQTQVRCGDAALLIGDCQRGVEIYKAAFAELEALGHKDDDARYGEFRAWIGQRIIFALEHMGEHRSADQWRTLIADGTATTFISR